MIARMLMVLLLALACPAARAEDSVRLHRTARVEPGRPVLLADIAAITGDSSERLAALILIGDPGAEPRDPAGWFSIDLARVRDALDAELGDKAGLVALSGSSCAIRVATAPAPAAPNVTPTSPAQVPDASRLTDLPTVRGAVARELCRLLAVDPTSLRLNFEPGEDAFLDLSIEGRVLEIAPTGSSDRMPISVAVHGPGAQMQRRTITVGVEVRRAIAVASRAIERGGEIAAPDLLAEERWLPPGHNAVSPDNALGAVARRRIDPGEPIEAQSIEPPVAVRRGDRLWVRIVTGHWVVRREATAADDARVGDEIEFASVSDSRDRFRAVVTGRGQAAVWTPPAPGTALANRSRDE